MMMRDWMLIVGLFVAIFTSRLEAAEPVVIDIKDAGFEAPMTSKGAWRFSQHAGVSAYEVTRDKDVFTEGKQSLKIKRTVDQVYGAISQLVVSPPSGIYRYRAKLRSKDVDGRGWMTYVRVYRNNGEWDAHFGEPLLQDIDWRDSEIKFVVPVDVSSIEIGVTLRGGGTGWVDAIRLEKIASE
jgi:hypothetical protein